MRVAVRTRRISRFLEGTLSFFSALTLLVGAFLFLWGLYHAGSAQYESSSPTYEPATLALLGRQPDDEISEAEDVQVGYGRAIPEKAPSVQSAVDTLHTVARGETLSEIAYYYGIDLWILSVYNDIAHPDQIRAGRKIVIPSPERLQAFREQEGVAERVASLKDSILSPASGIPSPVEILASTEFVGSAVKAHFSLGTQVDPTNVRMVWSLDQGRRSTIPNPVVTYTEPGTYRVSLTLVDKNGSAVTSNSIYIDVPYPSTRMAREKRFITLGGVGQEFTIDGEVAGVYGYGNLASNQSFPIEEIALTNGGSTYRASKTGYFRLVTEAAGKTADTYLFVSPVESKHADREDLNWYRTQFDTGSIGNCGPAVVSMGIAWAAGDYVAVSAVRRQIGFPHKNGATDFRHLRDALNAYGVEARMVHIAGPDDIFRMIDRDRLAVVLFDMTALSFARGAPESDFFGRYYYDTGGHYVIIKGYSKDRRYFVVYDPIPSDWTHNGKRYSDGVSMIGRNRYYEVGEIFGALRTRNVLQMSRS